MHTQNVSDVQTIKKLKYVSLMKIEKLMPLLQRELRVGLGQ
jgi:hypothetical protein